MLEHNPPLNRSAQQRDLPTGRGHQRARLALRDSHNRRRAGFIDSSNVLNRNIFYNLPGYGRWNDEIGGDKNVSGAKRDKLCRITATG